MNAIAVPCLTEPSILKYERTEYGKKIRQQYENKEVEEKIGNMRELAPRTDGIFNTLTSVQKDNYLCVPCLTPDRLEKRQNGRRFKEDGEPMFTLTGQDRHGVLQVGNYREKETGFTNPQTGRVYSTDGCSPTLNTMQGGDRQPKVIVATNNSKGYDIAQVGDSINIGQPNSKTRRGRVGHEVYQTLTTQQEYVTLTRNYRIRKLTPRECFRLMGLHDKEIDKIQAAGISNSQQYKLAGNSIVVDVLEVIARQLLGKGNYNV